MAEKNKEGREAWETLAPGNNTAVGETAPQFGIRAASADGGERTWTTWVRNKVVEPMLIYRDQRWTQNCLPRQ